MSNNFNNDNMTFSKIYRHELKAARRLFGWVDRHPYIANAILAAEAVIFVLYVFFYYPL